jgi:hypothetical protein
MISGYQFPVLLALLLVAFRVQFACSQERESPSDHVEIESSEQLPGDDGHLSAQSLESTLWSSSTCTCNRLSNHCPANDSTNTTNRTDSARIFYLVVIHNQRTMQDAVHLFRAIRDPRNTILIHIDVKLDFQVYLNSTLYQEIEACPCGSSVEAASVHDSSWGSWSMNLPTLWGMKKAVKEYKGKWDVFINLSGDTLPVYKSDRIARLFAGPLANKNFVTSSSCATGLVPTPIDMFPKKWHKRMHFSQLPSSLDYVDEKGVQHHKVSLLIYFGSQWMALLPAWCDYLIDQLERSDSLPSQFRDYLIETEKLMSDETFIPTLLMHLFPDTLPQVNETDHSLLVSDDAHAELKIYDLRYERMDENTPDAFGWFPTDQRYDVPDLSGVDRPRIWGPYFLGVYDLANIRDSGALFIRKVSELIDPNMVHLLPVDSPMNIPRITWPNEVEVIEKPDWPKTLAELKKIHKKKLAEKEAEQTNEDR